MPSSARLLQFGEHCPVTRENLTFTRHSGAKRDGLSPLGKAQLELVIDEMICSPNFISHEKLLDNERVHEGSLGSICVLYASSERGFSISDFRLRRGGGGGVPATRPVPRPTTSFGGGYRRAAGGGATCVVGAGPSRSAAVVATLRRFVRRLGFSPSDLRAGRGLEDRVCAGADMLLLHSALLLKSANIKVGLPEWSVLNCMTEPESQLSVDYGRSILAGELICGIGASAHPFEPHAFRHLWAEEHDVDLVCALAKEIGAAEAAASQARGAAIRRIVEDGLADLSSGAAWDPARAMMARAVLSWGLTRHVWQEASAFRAAARHSCREEHCETVIRKYALVTEFMSLSHRWATFSEAWTPAGGPTDDLDPWCRPFRDFDRSVVIVIDCLGQHCRTDAVADDPEFVLRRMSAIVHAITA